MSKGFYVLPDHFYFTAAMLKIPSPILERYAHRYTKMEQETSWEKRKDTSRNPISSRKEIFAFNNKKKIQEIPFLSVCTINIKVKWI